MLLCVILVWCYIFLSICISCYDPHAPVAGSGGWRTRTVTKKERCGRTGMLTSGVSFLGFV